MVPAVVLEGLVVVVGGCNWKVFSLQADTINDCTTLSRGATHLDNLHIDSVDIDHDRH